MPGTDMEAVSSEREIEVIDKMGSLFEKIYETQNQSGNEENWAKLKGSVAKGDLVAMGVRFNDADELKAFAQYAKWEGLAWAGLYDPKQGIDNGPVHIAVASSDIGHVKDILEQVTDDKKMQAIDNRITEISSKPDFSEQDLVNIAALQESRNQLRDRYHEREGIQIIREYMEPSPAVQDSFEEKVEKYVRKAMEKEDVAVIADVENPDRYIVCSRTPEEIEGEKYVKTEYLVHNPEGAEKIFGEKLNEEQLNDSAIFMKKDMKEFAGFSDDSKLVYFDEVESFELWKNELKEDKQRESFRVREPDEYRAAIEEYKGQLESKGYHRGDGGEVKRHDAVENARDELRAMVGSQSQTKGMMPGISGLLEALTIAEQIQNYEDLYQNSQDLAMAKTNEIIAETDEEKQSAGMRKQELTNDQSHLVEKESELVERRKGLNSMQHMPLENKEIVPEHGEPALNPMRASQEATREDGGHETPRSMEDYRGRIAVARRGMNMMHGTDADSKANEHGRQNQHTQAGSTQIKHPEQR